MYLNNIIFVSLLCCAMGGCASHGSKTYDDSGGKLFDLAKDKYDPTRFSSFVIGSTTKSQVISALGEPRMWGPVFGTKKSYLLYGYIADPVSPAAGSVQVGLPPEQVNFLFTFDEQKILVQMDEKGKSPPVK